MGSLWPIEPLPRETDGRARRKLPRIMLKSAINARGMPQIFINQKELETHFLVLGIHSVGFGHSGVISLSHWKPKMTPRRDILFY